MTWTTQRVDILKKCWADGLSAALIAAELGDTTRNAVLGKANRIGLFRVDKPTLTFARVRNISPLRFILPPKPPEIEIPPDQSPCAVTFLQLQDHHCRYPIGSRPFKYCGAGHIDESPYCLRHHRISYTKPERRRPHEADPKASDTLGLGPAQRSAVG